MLKPAKKRSNVDIQRIQRIARESRSETLADYKRVPKGFQQRKLKKTEENTAKMRLEQIPMLQSGVYCGNLLRRHLL